MFTLNSDRIKLDDLLNRIAESLQLDETRIKKMESSYKAVSDWIDDDDGFFKDAEFEIYPHGSVLIGTTVKPDGRVEFDLDFVIHLRMNRDDYDPAVLYDELKRRLMENDTYKRMLESKNRVLRLNYAGDFHMDIMPGCQESDFNVNVILIRDKKLVGTILSNPRGYGDWFNNKADSVKNFLLEKAYAMEDLPDQEPFHLKKPLKRAVQLIKRYRNLYFSSDPENATSSVILTTIAGNAYDGEDTIFDTIDNIINRLSDRVKYGVGEFKVFNPVLPEEEFTQKWESNPILFERFVDFVKDFKVTWDTIKRDSRIDSSRKHLDLMFGESPTTTAINKQNEFYSDVVNRARNIDFVSSNRDIGGLERIAEKSRPYLMNGKR